MKKSLLNGEAHVLLVGGFLADDRVVFLEHFGGGAAVFDVRGLEEFALVFAVREGSTRHDEQVSHERKRRTVSKGDVLGEDRKSADDVHRRKIEGEKAGGSEKANGEVAHRKPGAGLYLGFGAVGKDDDENSRENEELDVPDVSERKRERRSGHVLSDGKPGQKHRDERRGEADDHDPLRSFEVEKVERKPVDRVPNAVSEPTVLRILGKVHGPIEKRTTYTSKVAKVNRRFLDLSDVRGYISDIRSALHNAEFPPRTQ